MTKYRNKYTRNQLEIEIIQNKPIEIDMKSTNSKPF